MRYQAGVSAIGNTRVTDLMFGWPGATPARTSP